MPETYVAIDLETTGLDPRQHEIIEVGAVKFAGAEVLETFQTFVKPRKEPSSDIQDLTGIKPADLKTAPTFAVVAGDLLKFVGDYPVIAQNASFDLQFLAEQGLPLPNPVVDTLELAKVLLGQLPERNLPALAAHFGVEHGPHHRALHDAMAAKEVFLALQEKARGLDARVLTPLAALGSRSGWALNDFFQEILADKISQALAESVEIATTGGLGASQARVPAPHAQKTPPAKMGPEGPLNVEALAALLGPDGAFSKAFPAFEHRAEQVSMMRSVAEAFNHKEHLVVEAGTGTGKSMAYLLPALLYAMQNGSTVVVATNTIALQEQIVRKDIPALMDALGTEGARPHPSPLPRGEGTLPPLDKARFAVLKGRGNYLCPRRWNAAINGAATGMEPGLLARIAVWLAETTSGDRAELNLNGHELAAWRRLSAETDNCPGGQCAQTPASECFLQRARQRAVEAHVLVINHALLIADMVAGGSVLPEYDYLIIDEAHHLEDVATDQLGFRIGYGDVADLLDRLEHETGGRQQGLLGVLETSIRGGGLFAGGPALLQQVSALRARVPRARSRAAQLFALMADFLKDASDPSDYGRRVRLTPASRHHHLWEQVEQAWEDLRLTLHDLREGMQKLATGIQPALGFQPEAFEDTMAELEALHAAYGTLASNGSAAMARPDPEWVSWVASSGSEESATLYAAPIEVGPMLAKELFLKKASVVLTSATLKAGEGFEYIESRVGVEKPRELALESSFPYQETALLLLPQDLPKPQAPGYYRMMEQALTDLCLASGGRALVLFTSYAALQSAQRALREVLEPGIKVLAQGGGLTVQRMLERLRSQPNTVLLGTSSFWEGVDVVGEALSLLVITRLPFTVPTEPVFQARSERFEDPFGEYAVPQAVLRFRQGCGRLIRSRTDRGVCVVLDPRVGQMRYGRAFLEAIPPATVQRCMLREAPGMVREWLAPKGALL